ncbi:protein of unknown function DUF349 [Fibrella aestuarina BUZ 2]|uniref:DUF349 domain-containing protein n=1 Tax=Fibrella aestuarina BUZ 2 TaxID=1166018 RepID=I0K9P9_9BACT|nr:DUF349 domain-containing protein [Fibrella aestuarina]CCH00852.1 protein of unknown function DUF349 [Fibrella aestuarina BUZ 2]
MTNEEQQIDRPETANQTNAPLTETTPATDEVASAPASEVSEPAVSESVTESADALPVAEPSTEPTATDEPATEPVAQADVPVADAAPEAEPVAEATPDETPADDVPAATEPATDAPEAIEAVSEEATPADETPEPQATATDDTDPGNLTELAPAVAEEITASYGEAEPTDEAEEEVAAPVVDYSTYSKQELVATLDQLANNLKAESATPAQYRQADEILKQTKPAMDQLKRAERQAALDKYIAETGAEEGFQFRTDDLAIRYEELYKQIKSQKNTYFQTLDKAKDANFNSKTDLLRRLRELVESDEANAGDAKTSWGEFKKIQDEWKAAGNINSPHNATLWATYHALVDRYYSNRNIYFELKELDRKKNATQKMEVIEKVEAIAKAHEDKSVTRQTIDEANNLFEEYKHIGPAPKAEQEVLWQRMKAALDSLYEKRRGQNEEQRKESAQLYEEKSKIYEELIPLTSFSSSSINDWNDKTKEVMAIQDRWNAIKGPMPREEGKELSKKFWAALKTFFANKGEFFRQLESKREENLRAKTALCEQVEAILASGDESSDATQRVIELQKQWKNVGQVPEKQKNSIFDRFKAACDAFFDKKRNRNQDTDREFEANLAKKEDLIRRIEASATENADLSQLNAFKEEWNGIGFVPKKDKERIQKGYIAAINALVRANGTLSTSEKERAMQDNEAEVARSGGPRGDRGPRGGGDFNRNRDESRGGGNRENRDRGPRRDQNRGRNEGGYRESGDFEAYRRNTEGGGSETRRRINALENDIATYRNNIEFFARSKNADKLRADIEKKIADAQKQLDALRNQ